MKNSLFLFKDHRLYFLILYAAITSTTICFHEFWLDEWQAILISIDCQSVTQFLSILKLEQHPPLWYLLIKVVWFVYPHLASVKTLHILIALSSAYILLYKIEYPFYYRLAFLFSYFLLYEYTIISRNYGLVVLFGLLSVAELQKDNKNYLILFIAMAGMALSHINGLLLSISFCFYLLLISKDNYQKPNFILFISAYLFTIICIGIMLHPQGHPIVLATRINLKLLFRFIFAVSSYMWNAFVPIAEFKVSFWDSHLENGDSNFINGIVIELTNFFNWRFKNSEKTIRWACYLVKFLLFIPLLYLLLKPLLKSYKIIIPLFSFWLLLMLLQAFVYPGFIRHWGFYFISFIFFVFLSKKEIPLLKYFLAANVFAGLTACVMEVIYPFTSAKSVAQDLKSLPNNSPIRIDNYISIPPIYGYLKRPIYYYNLKTKHFYINWDIAHELTNNISPSILFYALQKEMKEEGAKEGVLILYLESEQNKAFLKHLPKGNFTLSVKEYSGSLSGEDFSVIRIKEN